MGSITYSGNTIRDPYTMTKESWERGLRSCPEIRCDVGRAAEILIQLTEGMRAAAQLTLRRGMNDFAPPDLHFIRGYKPAPPSDRPRFVYVSDLEVVCVDAQWLQHFAGIPRNAIIDQYDPKNPSVLAFSGTVGESYFLGGVEEGDHAREHQQFGLQPAIESGAALNVYDAQPHEYASLLARLEVARERNMSPIILSILERRIQAADLLRANK